MPIPTDYSNRLTSFAGYGQPVGPDTQKESNNPTVDDQNATTNAPTTAPAATPQAQPTPILLNIPDTSPQAGNQRNSLARPTPLSAIEFIKQLPLIHIDVDLSDAIAEDAYFRALMGSAPNSGSLLDEWIMSEIFSPQYLSERKAGQLAASLAALPEKLGFNNTFALALYGYKLTTTLQDECQDASQQNNLKRAESLFATKLCELSYDPRYKNINLPTLQFKTEQVTSTFISELQEKQLQAQRWAFYTKTALITLGALGSALSIGGLIHHFNKPDIPKIPEPWGIPYNRLPTFVQERIQGISSTPLVICSVVVGAVSSVGLSIMAIKYHRDRSSNKIRNAAPALLTPPSTGTLSPSSIPTTQPQPTANLVNSQPHAGTPNQTHGSRTGPKPSSSNANTKPIDKTVAIDEKRDVIPPPEKRTPKPDLNPAAPDTLSKSPATGHEIPPSKAVLPTPTSHFAPSPPSSGPSIDKRPTIEGLIDIVGASPSEKVEDRRLPVRNPSSSGNEKLVAEDNNRLNNELEELSKELENAKAVLENNKEGLRASIADLNDILRSEKEKLAAEDEKLKKIPKKLENYRADFENDKNDINALRASIADLNDVLRSEKEKLVAEDEKLKKIRKKLENDRFENDLNMLLASLDDEKETLISALRRNAETIHSNSNKTATSTGTLIKENPEGEDIFIETPGISGSSASTTNINSAEKQPTPAQTPDTENAVSIDPEPAKSPKTLVDAKSFIISVTKLINEKKPRLEEIFSTLTELADHLDPELLSLSHPLATTVNEKIKLCACVVDLITKIPKNTKGKLGTLNIPEEEYAERMRFPLTSYAEDGQNFEARLKKFYEIASKFGDIYYASRRYERGEKKLFNELINHLKDFKTQYETTLKKMEIKTSSNDQTYGNSGSSASAADTGIPLSILTDPSYLSITDGKERT